MTTDSTILEFNESIETVLSLMPRDETSDHGFILIQMAVEGYASFYGDDQ